MRAFAMTQRPLNYFLSRTIRPFLTKRGRMGIQICSNKGAK